MYILIQNALGLALKVPHLSQSQNCFKVQNLFCHSKQTLIVTSFNVKHKLHTCSIQWHRLYIIIPKWKKKCEHNEEIQDERKIKTQQGNFQFLISMSHRWLYLPCFSGCKKIVSSWCLFNTSYTSLPGRHPMVLPPQHSGFSNTINNFTFIASWNKWSMCHHAGLPLLQTWRHWFCLIRKDGFTIILLLCSFWPKRHHLMA